MTSACIGSSAEGDLERCTDAERRTQGKCKCCYKDETKKMLFWGGLDKRMCLFLRYAMKCLDKKRIKMKQGETLALNERIMLSLVSTGVSDAYTYTHILIIQTAQ